MPENQKTLVVCPIGLGNFIMMTPAMEHLNRHLGRENLHLLSLKPSIRQMGEETGYFSRIHHWDPDSESIARGLVALRALRRERYRRLVSLFPSPNRMGNVYAWLTGAEERIGFQYPHSRLPARLHTTAIPLDLAAHDVDQNLGLAAEVTGRPAHPPGQPIYPIPITHPQQDALQEADYFICHPGSSPDRGMDLKRLPTQSYALLIERIHAEFGYRCLLAGGPEEEELRQAVRGSVQPECLLQISSASLSELGCLILNARFFLGNDAGLMHIAAAQDRPCIAFFGPTDDLRSGPYDHRESADGPPLHLVLRDPGLSCTPCWTLRNVGTRPPCQYGDVRCLTQMDMEWAWTRIREFIANLSHAKI
ncbi:MAG: glycosyltransferase family 9 protein [Candidatus Latescibacteria bacterium]|jgi:ADP-heptose:LPS heptosyltransferase|nr:glycosyltransferase family 9 protein [Candidatus Latescibacterota bacterium]